MMNQLIAAGVALAVMLGAWQAFKAVEQSKGVDKERARVAKIETKVNDKIEKAQRAAAARPAASVLDKWSRP